MFQETWNEITTDGCFLDAVFLKRKLVKYERYSVTVLSRDSSRALKTNFKNSGNRRKNLLEPQSSVYPSRGGATIGTVLICMLLHYKHIFASDAS